MLAYISGISLNCGRKGREILLEAGGFVFCLFFVSWGFWTPFCFGGLFLFWGLFVFTSNFPFPSSISKSSVLHLVLCFSPQSTPHLHPTPHIRALPDSKAFLNNSQWPGVLFFHFCFGAMLLLFLCLNSN